MTLDAHSRSSLEREKDDANDICAHIFGVLNGQQVCGLDFAEYSGQIANAGPGHPRERQQAHRFHRRHDVCGSDVRTRYDDPLQGAP